jgi:tRNA threonylcarbamoyladenosine biosynthesis protein TsaE
VDYPPEQHSSSPQDTFSLGKNLGARLQAGNVVALSGPLGAGKTCFAKGIAAGLGIEEEVTSPTYTIVTEYESPGALILRHIDAYRLDGGADFEAAGGAELLSDAVVVVEWPEKIASFLPEETLWITIEITGDENRLIRCGRLP